MLSFGLLSWERIQVTNRINTTERYLHLSDVIADARLVQFIITKLFKLVKVETLAEPLEYAALDTVFYKTEVRHYTLNTAGNDLLFTNRRVVFVDDVDDITHGIDPSDQLVDDDLYQDLPDHIAHPSCSRKTSDETEEEYVERYLQLNKSYGKVYPLPKKNEGHSDYTKRRRAALAKLNSAELWACPGHPITD